MNTVQIDFPGTRSSPEEINSFTRSRGRRDLCIVGLGLMGLMIKLVIAFNTFGSNDAVLFYTFAKSLNHDGLAWTYQHSILFNHPPLTAYYLQLIFYLDHQAFFQANGLTFPVLLRLPGILGDFVVLLVLLEISKTHPEITIPSWAWALFALSPVSLLVSGFHGNTDPVMVMFLVLAAYMCLRNRPVLSGLLLALSCQIKIVPLLLLPIFFFFWMHRRAALSFLLAFAFTLLVSWSQPLTKFPALLFKNVLSYSGFWGLWGITYCLKLTALPQFAKVSFYDLAPAQNLIIIALKIFIIAVVAIIGWRRRKLGPDALLDSLAYAWIVFFVFSPGVCAQHMIWLAPFALALSPIFYGWLTASTSLFLFVFYQVTAGEFPWYVAMSTDKLNTVWTPWTILPWATLIFGMILFWKKAKMANPSLRLFSFQTLRAEARE